MVVSGLELWHWRVEAKAGAVAADIPPAEVDWLLQEVAGLDRLALRLESFKERSQILLQLPLPELTQLWNRRLSERVPVQYLVGRAPWRNFSLTVSPAVLIPRPETECLIDLTVACSTTELQQGHWADLGTGSGAIAIGLAEALRNTTIHAIDFSPAALAIAQQNAQQLGFADRIQFYQGSWFEPLDALKNRLSGMVSNPPYIPAGIIAQLQPEVTKHEPHLALAGGEDGLDCIRHLVETAPTYLRPGGIWLIEMMAGQAEAVLELLSRQGSYEKIQIFPDLAGVERFAMAFVTD
ncbi:peptide chain release factor N(5)-glutamine methyltransferase [Microcoleus sp. FACHB-672]|uniref:peptide chain release factor N(5)-glutamine methyltransferase n=1 Tax=Microcoleus sp. FACHB-672 TaxID=2692825 RepID=UPI0016885675|nr:peptide chain release factor N(5)-glutamine methyltransferase [Microcoleus sp. FACHB-672]MBD2039197.1 peptide chain release factor N(5)-glutamine methyltransferase [Microcoleus sp. FACHB-672]